MKLIVPFLILLVLLFGAVLADRPQEPADLVFVNRGEIHTLDPQKMSWMQDLRIAYNLYEGLVRWNNETFEIEPAVASSWEVSPDGLVYTFHLRPEAKWSNGDPVTAGDFVYSWRRALLPDTAADYSDLFFKIKGAEEFFNWRSTQLESYRAGESTPSVEAATRLRDEAFDEFDRMVGLKALDDHTLEVTLEGPTPYILDLFAFGPFFPVHPPTVDGWIEIDATTGAIQQLFGWTKPPYLVSNGPYQLTIWRYMRDMRLERNPYYWNPDLAQSDSILSVSIDDPSTAILAFETGSIDWLSTVEADYKADMLVELNRYLDRNASRISELEAEGITDYDDQLAILAKESPPQEGERNNIHAFPSYGTYFYNFNCSERLNNGAMNPFADARIRRAFTMAVDKDAIVQKVTRLNQPVARVFIPPGSIPGYSSPAGVPYDPAGARELLAEAGWVDRDKDGVIENERGEPFPDIEILYNTNGDHKYPAQAIASMWQQDLQVRAHTVGKESKTFAEDLKNHNFMVSRAGWYGDYGDPTTFLDLFRTGNGNNDRNYSNEYFDTLMAETDRETDPAKRMRLLEEAERFVMDEELPLLPIFHYVTLYQYDPAELSGISQHPRLVQYLWKMKVTR
ncbi:MAG: peptide ABC transporter substrate-binding protein [Phycisphaerales bacterium]